MKVWLCIAAVLLIFGAGYKSGVNSEKVAAQEVVSAFRAAQADTLRLLDREKAKRAIIDNETIQHAKQGLDASGCLDAPQSDAYISGLR